VAGVEKRDFDSPDETRTPDKTRVDTVHLGGTSAARLTMESGWRWSECVKPVAGTESCEHRHVGVVQSGRMRVIHDDGTELEIGPGDVYVIEPGHDAEVVGDDRFVGFEFQPKAAEEYARQPAARRHRNCRPGRRWRRFPGRRRLTCHGPAWTRTRDQGIMSPLL
jgi:mannose-6-phosphate isomerase-like protein (cupin superfamily)